MLKATAGTPKGSCLTGKDDRMLQLRSTEGAIEGFFISLKDEAASLLAAVSHFLTGRGVRAYLVGGFIRDHMLGRSTHDIDIAVAAGGLVTARDLAAAHGGTFVLLDRENGIGRVVLGTGGGLPGARWDIDFSTLRGSIDDDLAQRDFTIDAMAVPLHMCEERTGASLLIDPFDGRQDIKQRRVREVSGAAFEADPLRLLRAVRLAAELGFVIDAVTEEHIRHHALLISSVAGERVREELLRLLAVCGGGRFLAHMDRLGLLTVVFRELIPSRGAEQPKEHHWDVFGHSLQTVLATDFLLREGEWEYGGKDLLESVPWSPEIAAHFAREVSHGSTGKSLLRLAVLLHDVAKPQTRTIEQDGRMRFLGHADQGAAIAAAAMRRLRFTSREISLVETMVRHHLRPMQMSQQGLPSRRAVYRYFRDTGEAGTDTLFLSLADHLATVGPSLNEAGWREHTAIVEHVLAQQEEQGAQTRPARLVDGHDLMDRFGLTPGPEVGRLLEAVREAQAAGEVVTREQALELVRTLLSGEETE